MIKFGAQIERIQITDDQKRIHDILDNSKFIVDFDPDNQDHEAFYSIFAYRQGGGFEIAGKIGAKVIAIAIAKYLAMMANGTVEVLAK